MLLNKSKLSANQKLLGQWGEKRCEKFLKRKGLKKLAHNFSCKTGEIDLVMLDKDGTVVFVEVKTRAGEGFAPTEAVITYGKKSRLFKTAQYFLSIHKIENRPCRFDTVVIILNNVGHEQIRHYENAFVI